MGGPRGRRARVPRQGGEWRPGASSNVHFTPDPARHLSRRRGAAPTPAIGVPSRSCCCSCSALQQPRSGEGRWGVSSRHAWHAATSNRCSTAGPSPCTRTKRPPSRAARPTWVHVRHELGRRLAAQVLPVHSLEEGVRSQLCQVGGACTAGTAGRRGARDGQCSRHAAVACKLMFSTGAVRMPSTVLKHHSLTDAVGGLALQQAADEVHGHRGQPLWQLVLGLDDALEGEVL